jgi:hypothetical protein
MVSINGSIIGADEIAREATLYARRPIRTLRPGARSRCAS